MAQPAQKFPEPSMEVGIARLESDIEHIQADVTDLKLGQQRLDAKIDDLGKRLDTKIDDLGKRLDTRIDESNNAHGARFDKLEAKIDEIDRRHTDKADSNLKTVLWALGFVLAATAGGYVHLFDWQRKTVEQVAELSDRVSQVDTRTAQLSERVERLESRVDHLSDRMDQVVVQLHAIAVKVGAETTARAPPPAKTHAER